MSAEPALEIPQIRLVAVVATGVIGASWAALFLARGLDVVATDPAVGAEARLRDSIDRHWSTMQKLGLADGASKHRLRFEPELERALTGVDFVQESGPEHEDFKIDLFGRMDTLLPPSVILASSSSGLLMTRVQSACRHPERVILGHPFNPPHLIPLVEVIGGKLTTEKTIARAMAFYAALGKRPIHVQREISGHIANRLQAALWREAFHLVDQGVASVEDIDTAIAYGPGLRWALMGPFLALHLSGGQGGIGYLLDHLGGPIESWWRDLGHPKLTPILKKSVVDGVALSPASHNTQYVESERDALLSDLLLAKAEALHLP